MNTIAHTVQVGRFASASIGSYGTYIIIYFPSRVIHSALQRVQGERMASHLPRTEYLGKIARNDPSQEDVCVRHREVSGLSVTQGAGVCARALGPNARVTRERAGLAERARMKKHATAMSDYRRYHRGVREH